jgi:hypothetical protein
LHAFLRCARIPVLILYEVPYPAALKFGKICMYSFGLCAHEIEDTANDTPKYK